MMNDKAKEELREIEKKLEEGVRNVFSSEQYRLWLSAMSRFHDYSVSNILLIFLQKPNATQVAGFTTWQRSFHRNVKKGEHGIRIIAPAPYRRTIEAGIVDSNGNRVLDENGRQLTQMKEITVPAYKPVSVFDVSQTEGEPVPSLGVDELTGNVEKMAVIRKALEEISPFPIRFADPGNEAKGYFSPGAGEIVVREKMSDLQTLKTMIHEIAHASLHTEEGLRKLREEEIPASRHAMEVQAEGIAFAVCSYLGLDTSDYSFAYIAAYSAGKEIPELRQSLQVIRDTAHEILTGLGEEFQALSAKREEKDRGKTSVLESLREKSEAVHTERAAGPKRRERALT